MRQGFAPRRLGSVSQERWELPTVGEIDDTAYAPSSLNEDNFAPVSQSVPPVGRIPYPVNGAESTGLDTGEVLNTIDFRLVGEEVDVESNSDAESVFQPHLENMLKTIKRAKAVKKRSKVPEIRGLVPTVIPQLRIDESVPVLRVEGQNKSPENLQILPQLPDNTPPPTARKLEQESAQNLFVGSTKKADQGISDLKKENVKIVIDKLNSQVIVNNQQSPRNKELVQSVVRTPEAANRLNSADVMITTASVDLDLGEEQPGSSDTPSRLEIVITAVSSPQPPPNSVVSDSAEKK